MRTAVVALSTLAVALAATCGQTPIKPDLTHLNPKVSNDIVGGDAAIPYSWPWQVALCNKDWVFPQLCPFSCAGTVVAPGWVLTVGHCVFDDLNPKNWKVKAGVFDDAKSDEDAEQVVIIKAIHLHPGYNYITDENDIALVEVDTPLVYGDHVQPVCLPKTDDKALADSEGLWITGWGDLNEFGSPNRELRQANIPVVDTPTCKQHYPPKTQIFDNLQFCAGEKGVGICDGDFGGPVANRDTTGAWFQYGVGSFSMGCAERRHPGVFTRVTAYCDWIKTTTNSVVQCQDVAN